MTTETKKPKSGDLCVWWNPQVGRCGTFHAAVGSVEEGVRLMDILSDYDLFQLENKIKPDYCNVGGLQVFDASDDHDGPDGSWVDWSDEETGIDDPREWLSKQTKAAPTGQVE